MRTLFIVAGIFLVIAGLGMLIMGITAAPIAIGWIIGGGASVVVGICCIFPGIIEGVFDFFDGLLDY